MFNRHIANSHAHSKRRASRSRRVQAAAKRNRVRFETLEVRSLLSAAPLAEFQADLNEHFASGNVTGGFAAAGASYVPGSLSYVSGSRAVISAVEPLTEAVDVIVSPKTDWVTNPPEKVSEVSGDNNGWSYVPGWETGSDSHYPDTSGDGDLGGFTTIDTPPAPTSGPVEPFIEFIDGDTRNVLEMLSGLKYVPENHGEIKPDQLSRSAAAVAESNIKPASESTSPAQLHDQAFEGGMIALARVSQVGQSRPEDEMSSIDIDALLRFPPQMDSASGKYQAFETATDEAALLPAVPGKESSSMLRNAEIENLTQQAREPSSASPSDSDTKSSDALGAAMELDVLDASAARAVSDPASHVLDVAAAAAIVALGSHVARLREDPSGVQPLPAPSSIARKKTRRRQWPTGVWQFVYRVAAQLLR